MKEEIDMSGNGRRLLVVDDDQLALKMLSMFLERHNFDVVRASSGEEALKYLDKFFYAVVTDMHMHIINGNDVARAAKNISNDILVVLCFCPKNVEPEYNLFEHIFKKPIPLRDLVYTLCA